jgi:pimeloyl-ACP methyl ester carboxylesterase
VRAATLEARLVDARWQAGWVDVGAIRLSTAAPRAPPVGDVLTVYIEGDGYAWRSPSTPSDDPTPIDPVALGLALAQPGGRAAWIARPCQYANAAATGCDPALWTDGRFSAPAVDAVTHAVDVVKQAADARRVVLVGYSGGAAIAALVAARRDDVVALVTVAGNLDHRAWTAHHRVRPLRTSLDPLDALPALAAIRQWHFVGGRDRVVPPMLVESFAARLRGSARPVVIVEPDFDHRCCWVRDWPQLWARVADDDAMSGSVPVPRP